MAINSAVSAAAVTAGGMLELTVSRTTPTAVDTVIKIDQGDVSIKAAKASAILRVMDDVGPITGPVAADGRTTDYTPAVRIDLTSTEAVAGDKVQLFNGATTVASMMNLTATDISRGYKDITATSLSNGVYEFNAKVLDNAGHVSAARSTFTVKVDTATLGRPTTTSVTYDLGSVQGVASRGGTTDDAMPTLRLTPGPTTEVGDKVQLSNGTKALGEVVVLTAADITNGFAIITQAILRDGTYTFNATVSDAAGNTGSTSANYQVTVKAPAANVAAATFLAVAADSPTADVPLGTTETSGPVTCPAINDVEQQGSTSLLTGTSKPLNTVRHQDGWGLIELANADAAGYWSPPVSFTDAVHTLTSQCHDLIRCSCDVSRDHPLGLLEVRRTDGRFGGRPPDRKRRGRRVGRRAATPYLRLPQRFRQRPDFRLYAWIGHGCL
jgi:large repetitive protein